MNHELTQRPFPNGKISRNQMLGLLFSQSNLSILPCSAVKFVSPLEEHGGMDEGAK